MYMRNEILYNTEKVYTRGKVLSMSVDGARNARCFLRAVWKEKCAYGGGLGQ